MKKTALIILDGFGINNINNENNAIRQANTPNFDSLFKEKKFSSLEASGTDVGVLEGQIGNSEVGHMTIGAGRIVKQSILEINEAFLNNSFSKNKVFVDSVNHAKKYDGDIHIMGLLGPGGVHAHSEHYLHILNHIPENINVKLHLFGDGRDTSYNSLQEDLKIFLEEIQIYHNVEISSISGRFFAMDRDNNWERIEKAYNSIIRGYPEANKLPLEYINDSYSDKIYDEFLEPVSFTGEEIQKNDVVYFMNFRSDRARQITQAIIGDNFKGNFELKKMDNLYFVSMTKYYEEYSGKVFIEREELGNTLVDILEKYKLTHLHIAETEKYAHVTKFFNGGRHVPLSHETDILIKSHKVKTYDLDPEMSAREIYDSFISNVLDYDFTVVNFANPDMVGHTGNMEAGKKAIGLLDDLVGNIIKFAKNNDLNLIITSDHGNCEEMGSLDNPHTGHTLNPVPCFCFVGGKQQKLIKKGGLKDIAPTVLEFMGLEHSFDMTGTVLFDV